MPAVRRRALAPVLTALTALLLPLAPVHPVHAEQAAARLPATGTFFWANAWAAHHTAARGASSGKARMHRLVRLLRRHEVTLGTLAELERGQIAAFRRRAGDRYRLVTGGRGMTDGVFWDSERYDLVRASRFRGVTYDGRHVPVPVAVLRDRTSGGCSP